MSAQIDQGFGVTLAGATDVIPGVLRSVNWTGVERAMLNTTNASTTGGKMTFLASDLVDYGSWETESLYRPDDDPDIDEAAETWTLTFPTAATGQSSNPVNIACSCAMASFSAAIPYDDMMTSQATVKLSGDITVTASA